MSSDSSGINEICERLAAAFLRAVPLQPQRAGRTSEKEAVRASQAGLERFYEAARQERERHRLGLIARARVAFGVQQRLVAAGYPASLVKQVLFAMLVSAFVGL